MEKAKTQKIRVDFTMNHQNPPVEDYIFMFSVGVPNIEQIKEKVKMRKPHYEPFLHSLKYVRHYEVS